MKPTSPKPKPTSSKPSLAFDALTLHAVTDELRSRAVGGRVQKLALVDEWTVALELYAAGGRCTLLVSTDPHAARVCLTSERAVRASDAVTPLLLLLRKYVRDGRLDDLDQPPLERVLELRVSKRDDGDDPRHVSLIIEVMGRRSNIVLVSEDGTILDALRRASAEKNPIRPILPHRRYESPPGQDRLNPFAQDCWERLRVLAGQKPDTPVVDLLGRELAGFSGLLAREATFRAVERLDVMAGDMDWAALRASVGGLIAPARDHVGWAPSVALEDGCVVAFAAYRLRHLEAGYDVQDLASISEAVERGFADRGAMDGKASAGPSGEFILARPLFDAIRARRSLVARRRSALERSRTAAGDPDELREIGQALLGAVHEIRPGQESFVVGGRDVALDPFSTAVENAQRIFRDYKRAREAGRRVPTLMAQADRELAYLDEMETLVSFADEPGRVNMLREELRGSGILRDRGPRVPKKGRPAADGPRPLTVPLGDGYVALVGTSAKGNERVTFDLGTQEDIWLHARQIPGSHVILRTAGREPSRRVLEQAAELAAHFSKSRADARVPVDWTQRKHVRKIRGGPPGLVSYVNERTLDVAPRAPQKE